MDSKVNMPWHTNQVVKSITHMSWWAFHQISGRIPTFHLQGVSKGIATKIKTKGLRNRMIKTILKKYFQNTSCLGRGNIALNVLRAHILRATWVLIIEISCLKLEILKLYMNLDVIAMTTLSLRNSSRKCTQSISWPQEKDLLPSVCETPWIGPWLSTIIAVDTVD